MYFHYLEKADPEIASIIKKEMGRQENKIELIASGKFREQSCYGSDGQRIDE